MLPKASATRTFLILCLGAVLAPLDAMVNVAFPALTQGLGLEVADIRWVIIAYALTYSSLALVSGRIGDLYGHRRVFRAGLIVAALAFSGCAVAPDNGWLLAARVLQGVGIALLLGSALALALAAYPATRRTEVLARYAAVLAVALAVGPVVGGLLVDGFGWRSVFWSRAPIALAALVLLSRIPEVPVRGGTRAFDTAGAALLIGWMSALVLALASPVEIALPLAVVACVGAWFFVRHESRIASPILRPALFRDARFSILNLASIAVNFAGFTVFLLGPYFFARVSGFSAQSIGLLLACGPAGAALGAALTARLVMRFGAGRLAFAGAALSVSGVVIATGWSAGTSGIAMAVTLFVQGAGIGVFQVAYTDVVVAALPEEDRGVASSLANLTRTLGVLACATLVSALFRRVEAGALIDGLGGEAAFLYAFRVSFLCAAIGLGGFLAATLLRPKTWR
ncbi:MAG TPA: MFS transporter [Burkholderiales bacterium]